MNDATNDIDDGDVITDKLRQQALPLPPVALPLGLHGGPGTVTVRPSTVPRRTVQVVLGFHLETRKIDVWVSNHLLQLFKPIEVPVFSIRSLFCIIC